jgi:hypothetical protein
VMYAQKCLDLAMNIRYLVHRPETNSSSSS